MKHLLQSLKDALAAENHYAALALAVALPDICGWVLDPNSGSKARCVAWFERYMQPTYTRPATDRFSEHVFLNGFDFYALRCAYLHEGRDDITEQHARQVLNNFQFVVPPAGCLVHCNQSNNTLQLQVDVFCLELAEGTLQFMTDISGDTDAMQRMDQLLLIRDVNGKPLLGGA